MPTDAKEPAPKKSMLRFIMAQGLAPSGSVPSLSMKIAPIEVGRLVVVMLRCIERSSAAPEARALSRSIVNTKAALRLAAQLVRSQIFPENRSMGLLGLALMAKTPEGADEVLTLMNEDKDLLEAVRECASPKDEEKRMCAGRGLDQNKDRKSVV